jgi:hypothetical protein
LDGVALLAKNSGHPFTEDISYNVQVIPMPASRFIVVMGLDRFNEIFRSTLVPAFAKDSHLAGGAANFVGDHRSHRQVEVKPVSLESNGRLVKWTSNLFTFRASDLLNST